MVREIDCKSSIHLQSKTSPRVLFEGTTLAKKWHPDANKDDPEAETRFQEISKAYETVLFMEAVQGCTKTVVFETKLPCDTCGGSGVPPGTKPETCRRCKGAGTVFSRPNPFTTYECSCPHCGGSGKIVKNLCKSCNGHRLRMGTKSVKVNIMPAEDPHPNFQFLKATV